MYEKKNKHSSHAVLLVPHFSYPSLLPYLASTSHTDSERTSQFEMKLMDIDSDHLGIPDTTYSGVVQMPSHEFQRICRDLSQFSDSLMISCTKDGVEFSASGDVGRAKITVRQNASVDKEDEQVGPGSGVCLRVHSALRLLPFPVAIQEIFHMSMTSNKNIRVNKLVRVRPTLVCSIQYGT